MIDFMKEMLRTPEAQRDPYAWAATLLAHAWVGLSLSVILPWWVALLSYAAWEVLQWLRYDAEPWDCVLDWTAVALGICAGLALASEQDAVGAILALMVVLFVGVRKRR